MMNRLPTRLTAPVSVAVLLGIASVAQSADRRNIGYSDTPLIPGTKWHVHDGKRPQPPVVQPGKVFSHKAPPPGDATVLFDGTDLSQWQDEEGDRAKWKVENGYMEVVPDTGSIRTKDRFGDFQLHLEFATPAKVEGHGQGRGNSGVMINGLYEVQVLDSYNNPTYPDGQAGALYGQTPPLRNASKPPGAWQTYDIIFETPRWNDRGELEKKAYVTVIHNGVLLHHRRAYIGASEHREVGTYDERHPPKVFIELQDHSNPMRFRNIWIRELGQYDEGA